MTMSHFYYKLATKFIVETLNDFVHLITLVFLNTLEEETVTIIVFTNTSCVLYARVKVFMSFICPEPIRALYISDS